MKRSGFLFVLISLISIALSTPAPAEWQGTEQVVDGIPHMMNPAEGFEGTQELKLEEVWRRGGESEEEEDFFGVIADVVVDDSGNFYVLDAQLSEIKVYGSGGSYLGTIGREGEGPGEFRRPADLVRMPAGHLGVIQRFPSKMVLLEMDGTPLGDFSFDPEGEGFANLFAAKPVGDRVALMYSLSTPGDGFFEQKNIMGVFDSDGTPNGTVHTESSRMDYSNSLCVEKDWNLFSRCWTTTPDGRIQTRLDFTRYAIAVWGESGMLERVIEREYAPHPRVQEDIERIEKNWARGIARWVPNPVFEIEPNWNPVEDVYGRPDGSLWVRNSRGARDPGDEILARFDVFDEQGRYVKELVASGEFDPENDGIFIYGDHLVVVTQLQSARQAWRGGGDEEDSLDEDATPMELICYRMVTAPVATR